MTPVLGFAIALSLLLLSVAIALAALRLIKGPTAQDRVVALDSFYVSGMLMLLVLGIRFGHHLYFDVALLIALFGLAGSVAMAKFLLRGEVIE
ncbi:K+/H+ antiporter subunit F [Achromobacter sp. GG226]|uniref:K+/H+ antiporter subunit F n=1 Tax=Verticiella alkaliphila TaxID=2779529 RepID=UPI001C0E5E20|nr:K+/H+ antiporter subunit F [Verticiella sp. GG226]MBU4610071.1 K+/H+ antiporter subunit F [Verticiella sp. GG226]